MKEFLHHLFLPKESNNHRARLLHHPSLLLIIFFLLYGSFVLPLLQEKRGDVLGIQANIAVSELLSLTNKKRIENGLSPLTLNSELANAASQKASDMFGKNYWAHNGPDGTTPWVFIKSAGYDYLYAGENLARGFTTSSDIIMAWMESQGHRENILSNNYTDIGFAIVPGTLTGDETVLVVQMLGSKRVAQTPQEIASAKVPISVQKVPSEKTEAEGGQQNAVASFQTRPLLDSSTVGKGVPTIIIVLLLAILVLDIIIIERKQIFRVVSHNIDTALFFIVILAVLLIIGKGVII